MIEQIKMLPIGANVRIDLKTSMRVEMVRSDLKDLFKTRNAGDYRVALREHTIDYVSLLATLAKLGPGRVNLGVSGGLDSRVNIAAMTLSSELRSLAKLTCQHSAPQHQKDFEVVADISEQFGLPLNEDIPNAATRRIERVRNPLALWYLSNSGLYDFLVMPNRIVTQHPTFNIGGHGAELVKGQYGWRSMQQIYRTIKDKAIADAFYVETEQALLDMSVEFDDPIASEWHYTGYRNAIHSGRFVTTSMVGVRPFMNRELVGLARTSSWKETVKAGKSLTVIHDMITLMNPELASFRYDDERKNITTSEVEERLTLLGGPLEPSEIYHYEIDGEADEVKNGPSNLLLALASTRGHATSADRESLRELSMQGAKIATSIGFEHLSKPTLEEALAKLEDINLPLHFARGSIGKLLSFHLLD
ncbi:hypothetical protein [Glutamicibacter endophyticus]|uniref:hypothetical protein n=1 Tax=Glutamicibacter endophyticus TaxID=1522174 RepID=UPI003AF13CBB